MFQYIQLTDCPLSGSQLSDVTWSLLLRLFYQYLLDCHTSQSEAVVHRWCQAKGVTRLSKAYTIWWSREASSVSGVGLSPFLCRPDQLDLLFRVTCPHTKTALSCKVYSTQFWATEIHKEGEHDISSSRSFAGGPDARTNNCCRQGLTPTDHARLNRQAIKQMSLRNKETKQSNQQQEAHKIRAISRPVVKTPIASR